MEDDNYFAFQGVIYALSTVKQLASTNEVMGIPTKLLKFIDRWFDYQVKKAAGCSIIGVLEDTDMADMDSLVQYVKKGMLPFYLDFWLKFSVVEFDYKNKEERDKCKGRPDLFLSKIEELGTMIRFLMSQDPSHYLFEWFFNLTCMKKFILSVDGIDFYDFTTNRKEAFSPPYADAAMLGNKLPFMVLLFMTFETFFYEYYNKQLIVQAYLASQKCDTKDKDISNSMSDSVKFDEFGNVEFDEEDNNEIMKQLLEMEGKAASKDGTVIENEEKENSYSYTNMMRILYYILGAAIRSA